MEFVFKSSFVHAVVQNKLHIPSSTFWLARTLAPHVGEMVIRMGLLIDLAIKLYTGLFTVFKVANVS